MITDIKEMIAFIQSQKRSSKKVSLDRFKTICKVYGSPEMGQKYIHVGGTNGKGSVVSYLKNILREAGFTVGSYVSPYVICFNERIQYNGEYISDSDVLEIGNFIISKYDELDKLEIAHPTFFEFVTLMAFLYFQKVKPDYCIIEVGIGGLLDCTNIITPILSVISNVAYDHMNILGDTLEEIALNKLGIVKEGKALVTLENSELNSLFESYTKEKNAKLILVKKDNIKDINIMFNRLYFTYHDFDIESNMVGVYQTENISVAISAILEFKEREKVNITKENIIQGIRNTFWPGRFQIVSKEPFIIIDGAHNIDGINRLCETMRLIKKDNKIVCVFAVSKDKDKDKMIKELEKISDEMIFSSFDYKRSDDPNELIALAKDYENKRVLNDIKEYVDEITKEKRSDTIYLFCGSLYFVSELIPLFKKTN